MNGDQWLNVGLILREYEGREGKMQDCLLCVCCFCPHLQLKPQLAWNHVPQWLWGGMRTQACMDYLANSGTAALGATNCDERKANLLTVYETRNRYPGGWSLLLTEVRLSSLGNELMLATGIVEHVFLGKFSSEHDLKNRQIADLNVSLFAGRGHEQFNMSWR